MELIYADDSGNDIGYMPACSADFAYGEDENNFEVSVPIGEHCCDYDFRIYAEDSDFGGLVDAIAVNTEAGEVTYKGRTWHGILDKKILQPDAGEDYLIMTGDENAILRQVIARCGLSELFAVDDEADQGNSSAYQFDRYISAYKGLRKLGRSRGTKLKLHYDGKIKKVVAGFYAVRDYSQDEEWDSSQMKISVTKTKRCTNHIICLGSGELAERTVFHLYADADGHISQTQTLTGENEIAETYDYPNAESVEELVKGGTERLEEQIVMESADSASFDSDSDRYDVGDIVGARENITGIYVPKEITKKILRLEEKEASVEYGIGG